MHRFLVLCGMFLLFVGPGLELAAPAAEAIVGHVTLKAGDVDRTFDAIRFALPGNARGPMVFAKAPDGTLSTVQIDTAGDGWLLVPKLAAGASVTYTIIKSDRVAEIPVSIHVERLGSKLGVREGERPILEYQAEPGELPRPDIKDVYRRGGYIHPVTTPDGMVVTDDFAVNHVHHHGIWMAWTHTQFEGRTPDFWNMGDRKGRVEFVNLDYYWSGPVHGGFVTEHRFVDLLAPGGKTALNERWTLRVYPTPDGPDKVWVFDLESVQTCATDQPLILPEYIYGGLGIRGRGEWDGAGNAFWLTSTGETNRVAAQGTRPNWCYLGGEIDGKRGGIAVLCDPANFRAPQPVRVHPTEPYMSLAPQEMGEMRIEPGKPYVSRYRFIVMDGEPSKERIDQYWRDYAEPIQVEPDWVK